MNGKKVRLFIPILWFCLAIGWTVLMVFNLRRELVSEGQVVMNAICAIGSLFISIVWFIHYKNQDPS